MWMIDEFDTNVFLSPCEVVEHAGLNELEELENVVNNKGWLREQNIDTCTGKGIPHVGMQFSATEKSIGLL